MWMIKEKLIGIINDEVILIFNKENAGPIFYKWWRIEGEKSFKEWQKEKQ
jgi:hypothetical protein